MNKKKNPFLLLLFQLSVSSYLPPLVFAPHKQREVEEHSKEESPGHGYPQTVPLTEISNPLLTQYIGAGSDACISGQVGSQSLAHSLQHVQFRGSRQTPYRRVVEHLNSSNEAFGRSIKLVM